MAKTTASVALGSPAEKLTRRMFTRIIASVARSLHEHELSVKQLALLYMLDERGAMRIGDVAGDLGVSAPSASRFVDDVVRQGLVARAEDPADRRARVLTLTAKGRAFIAKSSEARMTTIAKALADLPADALSAFLSIEKSR